MEEISQKQSKVQWKRSRRVGIGLGLLFLVCFFLQCERKSTEVENQCCKLNYPLKRYISKTPIKTTSALSSIFIGQKLKSFLKEVDTNKLEVNMDNDIKQNCKNDVWYSDRESKIVNRDTFLLFEDYYFCDSSLFRYSLEIRGKKSMNVENLKDFIDLYLVDTLNYHNPQTIMLDSILKVDFDIKMSSLIPNRLDSIPTFNLSYSMEGGH